MKKKFNRLLRILGPGLITGAADDDPSQVAVNVQTGAEFGYKQLWLALFALPFMIAIQEACARIGAVTGKGLTAVVKDYTDKRIVYLVVVLVLIANTINIGADIGAMASAAGLIIPVNIIILTLTFTSFILILEIFTSYKTYAAILKWLALSLLAYPAVLFIVSNPWGEILKATFIPQIEFNAKYLFLVTGILGTTISPYMFFWQASEEVEEEKENKIKDVDGKPMLPKSFIKEMRLDNAVGMVVSQIATWSIIIVSASVLNKNGIFDVKDVATAARAFEPLVNTFPYSGFLAKAVFALGIIGLGLLAVPVLSNSASHAVSEALNWNEGFNLKFKKAHGFYGVITIATLIGLLINFLGIDPVKALIFSGVVNGVVAAPLIYLITRISSSRKIMGEYRNGKISNIFLWTLFTGMLLAAIFTIVNLL